MTTVLLFFTAFINIANGGLMMAMGDPGGKVMLGLSIGMLFGCIAMVVAS